MELRQLLRVIRRWWWLGALPVLVVAVALAWTFTPPATSYQVVLRFAAGSEPASALSADYDRYYAWLASEYVANGLADLATTSSFSQAVAESLATQGIEIAPQAIQAGIVTDNAQSILVVYLTWPDPSQAVILAEAIGQQLLASGPVYYPQMDGVGTVARPADIPVAVPLPTSLRDQLIAPILRLAVAAALGGGLMVLAHYVDPGVRDPDDLTATGLPLLATVPRPGHPRLRSR